MPHSGAWTRCGSAICALSPQYGEGRGLRNATQIQSWPTSGWQKNCSPAHSGVASNPRVWPPASLNSRQQATMNPI